jgi:hypothetical protein
MPRLTVKGFRGRPWKLCLNDDCPSMVEMRQKRDERKRAQEARKAATEGDGSDDGAAPSGDGRSRRRKPSPQSARRKPARSKSAK